MAVSVTSRPSTWSAVKNPIVYVFGTTGGPFTNYRIEVEVFKSADNQSLTGGVKFSFSPDGDGNTYADVSSIIKAYLKAEWSKPSTLNTDETDTYLGYYIKYQELYDGSATSQQNDSANVRYAVFGALQIPSANGNNLTDYVSGSPSKKFLTIFDKPKIWRGFPSTISLIQSGQGNPMKVVRKQFGADGSQIGSQQVNNISNTTSVCRLDLLNGFTLNPAAKTIRIHLLAPSGLTSIIDTSSGGTETENIDLGQTFPPGIYFFSIEAEMSVINPLNNMSNATITVNAFDGVDTELIATNTEPGESKTCELIVSQNTPFTITKPFTHLQFIFSSSNTTDYGYTADSSMFLNVSEEKEFEVVDPCKNPVLLFWKNSLGGDAWWLFDVDQEVSYALGSAKAKRMVLSANQLTANQWEALSELFTIGEVFKENIVQFTSSINKSHKREGSQVYVVDEDGNKTGVIVLLNQNNVMFTRMKRNQIKVEVEFPERFE